MALNRQKKGFRIAKGEVSTTDSASLIMKTDLRTLQSNDPLESLFKIFEADEVAIVKQGEKFIGLVTKIDFIKYLGREI